MMSFSGENSGPTLRDGLEAGGAAKFWERAFREALPGMGEMAPPGSRVLEVGYGDGLLSCFLCRELGWKLTGLEVRREAQEAATENARHFFPEGGRPDFRLCLPSETRLHKEVYDAVFVKTVFYIAPDLEEYGRWLDWVRSVLRPGGALINFETGRGGRVLWLYRKLRRREYTDLCLYSGAVEALYGPRFEIVRRRYYGGWSQFFTPCPPLFRFAVRLEEGLRRRDADHCFLASVLARKRVGGE